MLDVLEEYWAIWSKKNLQYSFLPFCRGEPNLIANFMLTGISKYTLALTVLAAGTSLPDLIASKIAAEIQPTADSAIANINARCISYFFALVFFLKLNVLFLMLEVDPYAYSYDARNINKQSLEVLPHSTGDWFQQLHQRVRGHRHSMANAIFLQLDSFERRVSSALCRPGLRSSSFLCNLCYLPSCYHRTEIPFRRRAGRTSEVGVGFFLLLPVSVAHFCNLLMSSKLPSSVGHQSG